MTVTTYMKRLYYTTLAGKYRPVTVLILSRLDSLPLFPPWYNASLFYLFIFTEKSTLLLQQNVFVIKPQQTGMVVTTM